MRASSSRGDAPVAAAKATTQSTRFTRVTHSQPRGGAARQESPAPDAPPQLALVQAQAQAQAKEHQLQIQQLQAENQQLQLQQQQALQPQNQQLQIQHNPHVPPPQQQQPPPAQQQPQQQQPPQQQPQHPQARQYPERPSVRKPYNTVVTDVGARQPFDLVRPEVHYCKQRNIAGCKKDSCPFLNVPPDFCRTFFTGGYCDNRLRGGACARRHCVPNPNGGRPPVQAYDMGLTLTGEVQRITKVDSCPYETKDVRHWDKIHSAKRTHNESASIKTIVKGATSARTVNLGLDAAMRILNSNGEEEISPEDEQYIKIVAVRATELLNEKDKARRAASFRTKDVERKKRQREAEQQVGGEEQVAED